MKKTSLGRRVDNGEWELLEDRVDIDSESWVTPSIHESVLIFAQEPLQDDEGVAFRAELQGDDVPSLQWDDAPGYLDPRTLKLTGGSRTMKSSEAKHIHRGIEEINKQMEAMKAIVDVDAASAFVGSCSRANTGNHSVMIIAGEEVLSGLEKEKKRFGLGPQVDLQVIQPGSDIKDAFRKHRPTLVLSYLGD